MADKKTNILIVGAGERGTAFLETLSSNGSIHIRGVVDINPDASGIKLAEKLGIPTAKDWKQFMIDKELDEVIDVTGDPKVTEALRNENCTHVVNGGPAAQVMWLLLQERKNVEKLFQETKEELEVQTWGLEKTNSAITQLYKELEESNKKLQELDRLKSDFISTISHELRTPLAITKEGLSLVIDKIPGPLNEKQENILNTAKDNMDRLARIINDLLAISRIETGKVERSKGLINLIVLIKGVISSLKPKAEEKCLELKINIVEEELYVYVEPDKITQIFTNLVENAIKYTEKGSVEIGIKEKDHEVECSVKDTGIGISEEDVPKAFDKFQQFGRTDGGGARGTGLGLSIAKGLVDMHNGKIWLDSKQGQGTTVAFTLPKYATDTLFKEYVNNGIKETMKNGTKMSLIIITMGKFNQLKQRLTVGKMSSTLKDIEGVLKSRLQKGGGIAFKDTGEIVVLLNDCSKESALEMKSILEQALVGYLTAHKLDQEIQLQSGCATYPDEAKNNEDLIKMAKA